MSDINAKLSERNRILDDIQTQKDFIEGKLYKPLLDKITYAKKERSNLLTEFKEKQLQARRESNPTILKNIEQDLILLCNKLSDIDSKIKELNDELQSLRTKSAKTPLTVLENELNKLYEDLNRVNEEISTIREKDRRLAEEEDKQKKFSGLDLSIGDYQKVVIDDAFGIYINYPKNEVISTTISCLFGSAINSIPKNYPLSKEEVINNLSNLNFPGLPTLLSMFIDTLLKAIGQGYVKQFFFFKNTIDLLAGFQFGELLGTYIPGLGKIVSDIKLLLTNPEEWMFKKMLGPLFDINIPIPGIRLDLGALIPFLPFIIKLPSIDPWGYFTKETPLNIDINPKDIPTNWREIIHADGIKEQIVQESNFKDIRNKKIKELDDKYEQLQNDINGYNKNTKQKEKSVRDLKTLNIQYKQLKVDVEKNKYLYDSSKLKLIEKELSIFCEKINIETKKIDNLSALEIKEQERLDSLNKDELKFELDKIVDERNDLKDQPNIVLKDFKKRALLIAYEQRFNDDELYLKLSNLWNIGVNIFNNKVTEFLQKIGHNFKDDKYIEKIDQLKSFGFKFNDSTHLERLYELGFSLNDPNHLLKLSKLKQYNIDILNTEHLLLFIEMGMNFNNGYFDSVVLALIELNVSLSDIEILKKLNMLGFNFNNPNSPKRLKILSKYIDISNALGYDNALSRNINLNNPYFEDILIRYNRIGLTWDERGVENFDQEILSTVKREDIVLLLQVINYYKNEDGNLNIVKYLFDGKDGGVVDDKDFISTDATYLNDSTSTFFSNFDITEPRYSIVGNANITDEIRGDNYIMNNLGEIYSTDLSYYDYVINPIPTLNNSTTGYTRVYWVSLFDFMINRYSKYGIKIDLDKKSEFVSELNPNNTIYDNNGKILKEYVYPNDSIIYSKKLDGVLEIQKKLELLLDFVDNQGWIINGVKIDDNYGQLDAQTLIDATNNFGINLQLVDIKKGANQVSYNELQGIYGNFDKLGLNVRDPNFQDKVKYMSQKLKIKADETVMLDVKRNVIMSYFDYNDTEEWKTIDLSTTKVDPKYYENEKYNASFEVTEIVDTNLNKQPTKTIVQFDSLNKMGFNFQQYRIESGLEVEDYANKINLLVDGLQFNMSAFQTVEIVDALCAIGWNFSAKDSIEKITRLKDLGFNFYIQPKNEDENAAETMTELKFKDMNGKLNSLINFGFHFEKSEWRNHITEMINLGIDMKQNDFESIISELISFGINLNDIDWRTKMVKLGQLGIDFRSVSDINTETIKIGDKKWVGQMSNLSMLGISFEGDNWVSEYNKAISFKTLGINYTDVENRQKIAILVSNGIDFEKPRDDYMQKLESLVQLKLITIPESVEKQKSDFLVERKQKLEKYQNDINHLKSFLNGDAITKIDSDIKIKRTQQSQLLMEINRLKSVDINNLSGVEITKISILLEKHCKEISILNDQINNDLITRDSIKKKNIIDIEKQIALLEEKKLNLDDKVYLLNSDIGLSELEKFKGLDKLGINYFDPKWRDNVNTLLAYPFNFAMPDWKTKINVVFKLIPKNPILKWRKVMINIIITLITLPIKILIGIIKMLLGLIKQVIGIPLNPANIPEWAKGIITKFNNLIKLITSLPTLDGMLDFLFKSTDGLMLIDIFVPGFSAFLETLKNVASGYNEQSNNAKKSILNKKIELSKLENDKLKKRLELENELKLKKKALDGGDVKTSTKVENTKLKNKQNIFARNIEMLKITAKNSDLSAEALDVINSELDRNCGIINDIENLIKYNNEELNNILNKPKEELQTEVNDLSTQLNNLDSVYNTDVVKNQISALDASSKELDDKAQKLGGFCSWKDNINEMIGLLREIVDFEKNKENPYLKQIKSKEEIRDNLNKEVEKINKTLNNTSNDKLNNATNKLNDKIKLLQDNICVNKSIWSDNEFYNNLTKLQEMERLKDSLTEQNIQTKPVNELIEDKRTLEDNILKTQKEIKELEEKSKEFNEKKESKILEFNNVINSFPVIINIMCCTPKFIVNIFVGMLNAIGYMEYLPILWEFDLIN